MEGMPANCSADVQAVVQYVDNVLLNGTAEDKSMLKAMFGAETLVNDDDFASTLASPIFLWQNNQFSTGAGGGFYEFCDAVELGATSNGTIPGSEVSHLITPYCSVSRSQRGLRIHCCFPQTSKGVYRCTGQANVTSRASA